MKMQTIFGEIEVGKGGRKEEKCFSPALVEKVLLASSKCRSAADASDVLRGLLGIEVTDRAFRGDAASRKASFDQPRVCVRPRPCFRQRPRPPA